jgi:predicted nucleotidyltransferase component of viral defense system
MLHYEAIDNISLALLRQLLSIPYFSNLYLAGGTSLALQIGHRKSDDLDLFGIIDTDDITLSQTLSSLGTIQLIKRTPNIHIFIINGIKVDIVNYNYPWIDAFVSEDQLRLAGKKDIAAMKLAAITGRGSRKDFIDLHFLLQEFNLREMLSFYSKKYIEGSTFLVLKSLTYFDDAETDPQPFMLKKADWKQIKRSIINSVDDFLNKG